MHTTSGRWVLGFWLAAGTTVLWSTVPIALNLLLGQMDAITITWYRFLAGAIVLGVALACQRKLPPIQQLNRGSSFWLVVWAGVALTANFVIYLYALNFIPPGASQVVMSLSPLFVGIGGVVLFRESFRRIQGIGVCLLFVGQLLFLNRRLAEFVGSLSDYTYGVCLILCAAVLWASYALAQKQLLRECSSGGLMLVFYGIGVVIMFPFCTLPQIGELSGPQLVVLAYASANTLIAYSCFAESLRHLEASRVSMVVSTTPLLALALSHPAHRLWPDRIMPEELNTLGAVGAAIVVTGSMLAALGGRRINRKSP